MKPYSHTTRGSVGRWIWGALLILALASCQKPEPEDHGKGKQIYTPVVQPDGMSVPG